MAEIPHTDDVNPVRYKAACRIAFSGQSLVAIFQRRNNLLDRLRGS